MQKGGLKMFERRNWGLAKISPQIFHRKYDHGIDKEKKKKKDHGKKWEPWNDNIKVWRGAWKICTMIFLLLFCFVLFLHQASYTNVCERSLNVCLFVCFVYFYLFICLFVFNTFCLLEFSLICEFSRFDHQHQLSLTISERLMCNVHSHRYHISCAFDWMWDVYVVPGSPFHGHLKKWQKYMNI